MLRSHAKSAKVAKHGARAIANMAAGSRDGAQLLVAQGARAVLKAIAADPDSSPETQTRAKEALAKLA